MATQAKEGTGITLTVGGNLVAELDDGDFPTPKTDMLNATNHGSPGKYREKVPGQKDPGTITAKGNFIPGDTLGQIVLMNARKNDTLLSNCIIALPPVFGTACTFNAYVSEFKITSVQNNLVKFEAVFELTGEPVYSSSASTNLTGLTISVGTLVQAFAAGVYAYIDSLPNGTASVTVVPTNATAESITVNGTVVASGATSGAIATPVGNTLITIITKDAGKVPVVYVINCGRAA